MTLKFNPVTNRFETAGGVDSPPNGFAPAGTQYVDIRTGETKLASGRAGVPDTVLKPAAKTTTTVKPTTTTVKSTGTTTATSPVKTKIPTGGKTTTTGQPVKAVAPIVNARGNPSVAPVVNNNENTQIVRQAIAEMLGIPVGNLSNISDTDIINLANQLDPTITGGKGSGGGSSAATAAMINAQTNQKATDAKIALDIANAQYGREQAKTAAGKLTQAGEQAQSAYNKLGEQAYSDITTRAGQYYPELQKQATGNIDTATADFLKNLIAPTAYSNTPVAQLSPAQQGLMANLQAYGASGNLAGQQMTQDVANNDFLAGLMRSSNQGLQSAESDYFNSLKNAASGGQAAAKQNLATIMTGLQGQTQTDAERLRREYLQKGLEALLSGQTNAANMLATNG
jgi:hypothetical protein